MRTSALFGAKNLGFFEIYGVSARTGGVKPSGHFADKEEGESIFRFFCERLLWTAPNYGNKVIE